ncbi:MAG: class I SAM-dependent methyltransferase [Deltaproteobacteria bacterium]|nr:class I SAM-dependent methyltransferase [Deltaproteobacteria bacterium]
MKQITLVVPTPAEPARLDRFLCAQLHGLSRRKVKGILDAGQVRVGARPERKAGLTLTPGQVLTLDLRPSLLPCPTLAPQDILSEGQGWLALNKPPGLPTHRPSEDVPGVPEALDALVPAPREAIRPAHRLDRATSGVLLVALDDTRASSLSSAFGAGLVTKRYRAVVSPAPEGQQGVREDPDERGPMRLSWRVLRRSKDGLRADLEVCPEQGRTHQIRRQLAAAGWPIVGDLIHGRALPGGAPRMALHCEELRWDGETVTAPLPQAWDLLLNPGAAAGSTPPPPRDRKPKRRQDRPAPTLRVSAATTRVLAGGHPWVLPDRDTGDLRSFTPGDQALLVDTRGRELGVALVDPGHDVVARLLDPEARSPLTPQWFADRTRRALRRRASLLAREDTDCGRLINGESDGLPGLVVDRWADALVLTRSTQAVDGFIEPVVDVLGATFPGARMYLKDHIVDLRRRGGGHEGEQLPGRWLRGGPQPSDEQLITKEAGLHYRVEPFGGLTTGFYPDQRDNRARLAKRIAPSSRVLNLFAHTAAFSVCAAAAGAQRTVSVDLSHRYCTWAEENLARNGLDPARHTVVASASDRFLQGTDERFDGVVIDPPAFARGKAGARGWSARRDYGALVEQVAGALSPGACWLLCVVNLKGTKPAWLRQQVESGLRAAGRTATELESAPPARDFPSRRGFPEGRPFVGVFVSVPPRA